MPIAPSKTSLEGWKRLSWRGIAGRESLLKNFLRGMETGRFSGSKPCFGRLKNFLRGMETPGWGSGQAVSPPPQKLP